MKLFGKTKNITVIIAALLLVSLVSATFAWLSFNRETESAGIAMTIDTSPNLVISDSSSALSAYTSANWSGSYVVHTWSDAAEELIPADHYDSTTYPSVTGTDTFGLVYNSNPENVSRSTGRGESLTFAHVPADGEGSYFIDKTVYIASLDKAMTRGTEYNDLVFEIEETGSGTTTNSAYRSASVDVYVAGTYEGTLNLDTLSSITVSDVASIPLNTSGNVEITFRCYFDGALPDPSQSGVNYVNSSALAVNTANISFDITISAVD